MKYLFLCIFSFACIQLFAQKISYPSIPKTAVKWQGFIPKGWEILDTATGDLNKDGWKDVALALQLSKPIYFNNRVNDAFIDSIKTQPRIFILSFYNKKAKVFDRLIVDTTIIPRNDSTMNIGIFPSNMTEPLRNISIRNGILFMEEYFANSLSRVATSYTYKFRFQKNEMALIGATYWDYTSGHDETMIDFNFSTGKYIKSEENGLTGIKQKPIFGKIPVRKIPTLNQWHSFEVLKGIKL